MTTQNPGMQESQLYQRAGGFFVVDGTLASVARVERIDWSSKSIRDGTLVSAYRYLRCTVVLESLEYALGSAWKSEMWTSSGTFHAV
jgi:hypothetical protein